MIFGFGLTMYGRAKWPEAVVTRKDFNTVLIRQDKKLSTSELFKVIQDAIPLILNCRTMCCFRTISSSTFIMWICSQFTLNHKFRAGGQNSSREERTVFFTAVNPTNKKHKDQQELDSTRQRLALFKQKWKKGTGIRCTGSIHSLLNGKD